MPATIQRSKTLRKPAQKNRGNTRQGVPGVRKNECTSSGAEFTPAAGIGLHLLEEHLKPANLFELAMNSGNIGKVLSIVNTEEKQLQAIEDLYQIVVAHPRYKGLREPNWKPDTPPTQILYWLLRKLGTIACGADWTVDAYEQGGKMHYQFVYYRTYSAFVLRSSNLSQEAVYYSMGNAYRGEYFMPLDFLPFLEKRDKALHDMIIEVVALVSGCNKIPLWDEDGDFSAALSKLTDPDNEMVENNEMAYRQRKAYQTIAGHYLDMIKSRRRKATLRTLRGMIERYDAKSYRQHDVLGWVIAGERIAASKKNLLSCWVPSYINPKAFIPARKYKFVWSLHKNDYLQNTAYPMMSRDRYTHGEYLPVISHICRPGCKSEIVADIFPEVITDFINSGYRIFFARYETYFYGNRLRDAMTPSETLVEGSAHSCATPGLLEIINEAEIKSLGRE